MRKALISLSALLCSACTANAPVSDDRGISIVPPSFESFFTRSQPSLTARLVEPSSAVSSSAASSESFSASGDVSSGSEIRLIRISANDWKFVPDVIAVRKNDLVRLIVTGTGGARGFAIPQLRIHETIPRGKPLFIDLPTDVPGTYEFLCSMPCGEGHPEMTGSLLIR